MTRAIVLHEYGGPEKLRWEEVPVGEPGPGELLVRHTAIGVNFHDTYVRSGSYKTLTLPGIPGVEAAGVVEKIGPDVTAFIPGDRIVYIAQIYGAYSEKRVLPASLAFRLPDAISDEAGASLAVKGLTACMLLRHTRRVLPEETILIHAAAGGVGHFAVQVAKYLGAQVTGTSSAANKDFILGLGADHHIDYRTQRFEEVITDADLVLDAIGKDNIDRSLEAVRPGGTLISIPSGLNEQVTEKARAKGVNGFFFLVQSNGDDMRAIADLLQGGHLKAHVGKVFPFSGMGQAHLLQETGRAVGKIVVTV